MTASVELKGAFHINSGEALPGRLAITREVTYLNTLGPRADKGWSYRDRAGHFHAYSTTDERYPTLFEVDHTCDSPHLDGDAWWCECWTEWQCRICGEVVTPGVVAGPHQEARPGLMSWEVLLDLEATTVPAWDIGGMVTVEAVFYAKPGDSMLGVAGARPVATSRVPVTRFGIAVVTSMNVQSFGDLMSVKAVLMGAGSLGERGKR